MRTDKPRNWMRAGISSLNENNMEITPALSIVLPAYKEKENLAILIPNIEAEFRDTTHEVIIVDDNSQDGTRELVQTLNARYRNLTLIERPGLMGIGSALRDGYNKAQGEYILSSDADLSFAPKGMRSLYEKVQTDFDLVLGFKIADALGADSSERAARTFQGWCENCLISPLSNLVIGMISGIGLKNYNTNFRVIRSSTWKRIRTVEDRQFFLFETIFRTKQAGARISEIPVVFLARKFGTSKVSFFKQAPKYFFKLLRIVFFDWH